MKQTQFGKMVGTFRLLVLSEVRSQFWYWQDYLRSSRSRCCGLLFVDLKTIAQSSRNSGHVGSSTHFSGNRVNQDLRPNREASSSVGGRDGKGSVMFLAGQPLKRVE